MLDNCDKILWENLKSNTIIVSCSFPKKMQVLGRMGGGVRALANAKCIYMKEKQNKTNKFSCEAVY